MASRRRGRGRGADTLEPQRVRPARERPTRSLSPREIDVLRLVAVGASTGQIARELSISKRSVRLHAERVREKTGARSRAELAALAVRDGFLPMAEDEPGRPPLRPER